MQEQTFRCPECGSDFPTEQALEEHVSREHMGTQTGSVPRQEVCPACSQEFPSAETLEEHQLTHR